MEWNDKVELKSVETEDGVRVNRSRAVVESQTGRVLGLVSDRYRLIPNEELFNVVEPVAKELNLIRVSIKGTKEWAKTFFKFLSENSAEITDGDRINFGLEFFNSYDGSLQIGYHIIANRLVCSNGLVAPRSISTFQIRHFGRIDANTIRERLVSYGEDIIGVANLWRRWAKAPLEEERVDKLLKDIVGERLAQRFTETYRNLKDKDKTLWGLYNVMTFYTSHNLKTRKGKEANLEYKRFGISEFWAEQLMKTLRNN